MDISSLVDDHDHDHDNTTCTDTYRELYYVISNQCTCSQSSRARPPTKRHCPGLRMNVRGFSGFFGRASLSSLLVSKFISCREQNSLEYYHSCTTAFFASNWYHKHSKCLNKPRILKNVFKMLPHYSIRSLTQQVKLDIRNVSQYRLTRKQRDLLGVESIFHI